MWALRHPASWLSLNLARFVPSTSTSPSVQRSMPASRFSKVLFPDPLGPINARKSPCSIFRLTLSRATTSKPSRAKRLLTLRTCTIVSAIMLRFLLVRPYGSRLPYLLSRYFNAISIAQLVGPRHGGRFTPAQPFENVVEISRRFAETYDSLFDAITFDNKNKIAAVSMNHGGFRSQHPRHRLAVCPG